MPFLDGFDTTREETVLTTKQEALLVEGLAFLFEKEFVYVDCRPPNLLTDSEGGLRLIDYDDMFMFDKVEDGLVCFEGAERGRPLQHLHRKCDSSVHRGSSFLRVMDHRQLHVSSMSPSFSASLLSDYHAGLSSCSSL